MSVFSYCSDVLLARKKARANAAASKIAVLRSSLIQGFLSAGRWRASSGNLAATNRAIWFLCLMPQGKKVLFTLD